MPSKKLENSALNSALGIPTALKVGIYVACGTAVASTLAGGYECVQSGRLMGAQRKAVNASLESSGSTL